MRRMLRLPQESEVHPADHHGPSYPLPETMPAPPDKLTPSDVLAQLVAMRAVADTLPDSVAQTRLRLQQGLDLAQQMVRQALPKPGTYVTAGSATAIGVVGALIGAVGGGLIGWKVRGEGGKKTAALPGGAPSGDHAGEMTLDDEIATYEGIAAEAKRRARAARESRAGGAGKRSGAAP